ncbi:hypothetical protein [Cellulomonas humilata]|uniref:PKD domain-containing protein n=1 Tax=Cellulomonas humilata TaxID=144055 RepID=A0ABU0EFC6_9CELL|nr:hypothetical protein [Cellulomonas humilata]MDQ0373761.1 hypothetical protein [Cellulomonas humilata]
MTAAIAFVVVATPLAMAVYLGAGAPLESARQTSGRAWVASPEQGVVSLIDGSSHEVVVSVPAPDALVGDDLAVTQAGSSAYVVDRTLGTVARIDGGTFEVSEPAPIADPGGHPQVLQGGGALYLIDPVRRIASRADPDTLEVEAELSLAAQPGDGQAVVDDAGRLWVIDATSGDLIWFDEAKHSVDDLATPASQLVLVQGGAVLVDVEGARAIRLGAEGGEGRWSCVGLPPGSTASLLGSVSGDQMFAAVPDDGRFVVARVGRDDCATSVQLADPGTADFGPLAQDGRYVFVPDRSTGRTAVVDTVRGAQVADLSLTAPGNRVELTAKDGIVFYNDLDSDVAGVLALEAGDWKVAGAVQKYDPATDEGVAVVGGDAGAEGSGDSGLTGAPADWVVQVPTGENPSAPSAPSGSVVGSPVITEIRVRPDPTVLGLPVTFTPKVSGSAGSQWSWTLTAADGSVVWESDEVGAVETVITGSVPETYTLGLEIVDARGHRTSTERPVDTVLVPTPHIEAFLLEHAEPAVGQVANIAAVESGLSGAEATWEWSVLVDGKPFVFASQPPAGAPFPMVFASPGTYDVILTVTHVDLVATESTTVTVSDQCGPALAGKRFVDLRADGTATMDVLARSCFVDTTVGIELPPWLSGASSVDVPAAGNDEVEGQQRSKAPQPVPVDVTVVGSPPADGLVPGAITLVLGDRRVPVDVRVNLPPSWSTDPECTAPDDASGGRTRFSAGLVDADSGSLVVRLTLDGVDDAPDDGYLMLPVRGEPGRYELLGPPTMPLAGATSFSVRATDRFGAESEMRSAPVGGCAG